MAVVVVRSVDTLEHKLKYAGVIDYVLLHKHLREIIQKHGSYEIDLNYELLKCRYILCIGFERNCGMNCVLSRHADHGAHTQSAAACECLVLLLSETVATLVSLTLQQE